MKLNAMECSSSQAKIEAPAIVSSFLDRITQFKNNPPAEDWSGIFTFAKK